jgi:alpha-tubulin suppressor-like RCC1 family protein
MLTWARGGSVSERQWKQRWRRCALTYFCMGCIGLCSACVLDWRLPRPTDGGTTGKDSSEQQMPPSEAGMDTGPDDAVGASEDGAAAGGSARDAGSDGEVGMDASSDAVGPGAVADTGADSATDAALPEAAPPDADAGVDAGCGPDSYEDGDACVPNPCADVVCGENQHCQLQSGKAVCLCLGSCLGRCVDPKRDRMNCGDCGRVCAGSLQCIDGACEQPVQQLILGSEQTCALRRGGTAGPRLLCWGVDGYGLFRDSADVIKSELPRQVVEVPEARLMVLSNQHRCMVPPGSDLVRCWGQCNVECGVESNASLFVLYDTASPNVVGLAASSRVAGAGTCMLSSSGEVRCMGWGPYVLDTVSHKEPVAITFKGEPLHFRAVQAGYEHICGIVSQRDGLNRQVVCWGRNSYGQLGSPEAPVQAWPLEPTEAPLIFYVQKEEGGDLTSVSKISTGANRSCAVTDDRTVYCWGENSIGMLGHGDQLPHVGAVLVQDVNNAMDVAVGAYHTCVLSYRNEVSCWGSGFAAGQRNREGDLGGGSYFGTPQRVPNLKGVIELRAGDGHTCVRLDTGAVKCWGDNLRGQLGDGTSIDRGEPTLVPGLL